MQGKPTGSGLPVYTFAAVGALVFGKHNAARRAGSTPEVDEGEFTGSVS